MTIVVVGLNHRSAPVEIREKVAFASEELPARLQELSRTHQVPECVILSTCNRVEIYGAGDEPPEILIDRLIHFLHQTKGLEEGTLLPWLYRLQPPESLCHLFRVAAGMDSMVLGETEIFGQVKEAYEIARRNGFTGRYLNRCFQRAFHVAKKIRSETQIQRGNVSVSSIAVDLAEKIFDDLSRCAVMIIGAGETGEKAARAMVSRGARHLWVSNRSPERAYALAQSLGAEVIPFDQWPERLVSADIVLFSTAAPKPLLTPSVLIPQLQKRRGRPLLIIDIAVPRNVESTVAELEGVFLYDIDDLRTVAEEARRQREQELARCEEIVQEAVRDLLEKGWYRPSFRLPPYPSPAEDQV